MKELDKLLESTSIDDLLNIDFNNYTEEERQYLYEKVTEIADQKCYQVGIEYNIRDVELVEKLDGKHKIIDLALTLSYDNKCNYEDVFQQVRMWTVIITNRLMDNNIVVPAPKISKKSEKFIGAYVKEPLLGIHKWVASFDLNSLYPHLIIQYNISPDTIIEPEKYNEEHRKVLSQTITIDGMLNQSVDTSLLNGCTLTPNGQLFTTKQQGFLPKIMEEMYNDRTRYKKEAIKAKKELEKESDPLKRTEIEKTIARYNNLQLAKKVSLNSAYGSLGNEYFLFFDVRQASAITTAGQLSIRWIENKLNVYLNKLLKTANRDYVIASDTDSIYLVLDELVCQTINTSGQSSNTEQIITFLDKVCENKIQSYIDKCYNELARYTNAYAQKMIMKREALADKGIWTAKKHYILNVYNNEGVAYKTPEVKIMGLGMIKSSTPSACRVKLKEALDVIINKTENDVIEFIKQFRKDFKILPVSDIAFPRGVNGINKYTIERTGMYDKGSPIHVRGSILYNLNIKKHKLQKKYPMIMEGEKIKFIYLKEPNTLQSNVMSFHQMLPDEFDLNKYIDYDTQFEKSFLEPLKTILDCIGWKTENVNTLESYFN